MSCCILFYVFIGRCSIDLNCIALWISRFVNRLKPAPFILFLAILCGYDFISKASNNSSHSSPLDIYPKMAFRIFSLSAFIFLVTAATFLLKLTLSYKQLFPCDNFSQKISHNVICQRRFPLENYYDILSH